MVETVGHKHVCYAGPPEDICSTCKLSTSDVTSRIIQPDICFDFCDTTSTVVAVDTVTNDCSQQVKRNILSVAVVESTRERVESLGNWRGGSLLLLDRRRRSGRRVRSHQA